MHSASLFKNVPRGPGTVKAIQRGAVKVERVSLLCSRSSIIKETLVGQMGLKGIDLQEESLLKRESQLISNEKLKTGKNPYIGVLIGE